MTIYEENAIIQEVGQLLKSWGLSVPAEGYRRCGGWFEYWQHINQTGQFKLKDGRRVVLTNAELRLALDVAERKE